MSLKKIAAHINAYCTFCKANGVMKQKAVWRMSYNLHDRACDAHKADLEKIEAEQKRMDSHHSEADYQTWMRL